MFLLKKKCKFSFTNKIFVLAIAIVLITITIAYALSLFFTEKYYVERRKIEIERVVYIMKDKYNKHFYETAEFEEEIQKLGEIRGIEVLIFDENFEIIYGNVRQGGKRKPKMPMGKNKIERVLDIKDKFVIEDARGSGAKFVVYSTNLDGGKILSVRSSISLMKNHENEVKLFYLIIGIISLFFSGIVGYIFSKKITNNLVTLTKTAENISNLKFENNINVNSNDEIGELGRSIEKMSEKISLMIGILKGFVSNASHELKTPVSVISTHAESLLRGQVSEEEKKKYYNIISKKAAEMNELIYNLLLMSKLESFQNEVQTTNVEVLELINNSLEKYDFLEYEKDLNLNNSLKKTYLKGDIRILKVVFDNIIQNAFKYSVRGGEIEIFEKEGWLYFTNKFEGKLELESSDIFQPFKRGENTLEHQTEGNGLGLSIVKNALDFMKIEFAVEIIDNLFIFKLKKET